jgi:hypothetical protein
MNAFVVAARRAPGNFWNRAQSFHKKNAQPSQRHHSCVALLDQIVGNRTFRKLREQNAEIQHYTLARIPGQTPARRASISPVYPRPPFIEAVDHSPES